MDNLPIELIVYITSFIEREDDESSLGWLMHEKPVSTLPPYATISRKWQLAIESRTFRSIHLKSTELSRFAQILTGHRKRLLAHLAYDVVLPTYDDKACAKFETEQDKERNNQAFTYAIHALYQTLKSLEGRGTGTEFRALTLDIHDIYAPMDGSYREKYEEDKEQWASGQRDDLWEHRYEHSILRLLEHPELPFLLSPSSFNLCMLSCTKRIIEPKSALLMARRLSNVHSIELYLSDEEKKYPHIRQQSRYGIVNPSTHAFCMAYKSTPSTDYAAALT
ncbi:MAG: hypothetical protein Q9212_005523 [Teloschistes hypoglaucus]